LADETTAGLDGVLVGVELRWSEKVQWLNERAGSFFLSFFPDEERKQGDVPCGLHSGASAKSWTGNS